MTPGKRKNCSSVHLARRYRCSLFALRWRAYAVYKRTTKLALTRAMHARSRRVAYGSARVPTFRSSRIGRATFERPSASRRLVRAASRVHSDDDRASGAFPAVHILRRCPTGLRRTGNHPHARTILSDTTRGRTSLRVASRGSDRFLLRIDLRPAVKKSFADGARPTVPRDDTNPNRREYDSRRFASLSSLSSRRPSHCAALTRIRT